MTEGLTSPEGFSSSQPCVQICFLTKTEDKFPLPDHRLLVLKCQGLWCMAECHLYREELSSPLPLHLHLVSVSYHIFSWPRSWLPEKKSNGHKENSCLASSWNQEGGDFKHPPRLSTENLTQGFIPLLIPWGAVPQSCGASLIFLNVPRFGESCGFEGSWGAHLGPKGCNHEFTGCQGGWLSPAAPFGHCRCPGHPQCSQPQIPPWQCPLCRPQCHQLVAKLEASLSASFAVSWIIYCNYAGDPHKWCCCALYPNVCKHAPRAKS